MEGIRVRAQIFASINIYVTIQQYFPPLTIHNTTPPFHHTAAIPISHSPLRQYTTSPARQLYSTPFHHFEAYIKGIWCFGLFSLILFSLCSHYSVLSYVALYSRARSRFVLSGCVPALRHGAGRELRRMAEGWMGRDEGRIAVIHR
jgi:hypothetical protein